MQYSTTGTINLPFLVLYYSGIAIVVLGVRSTLRFVCAAAARARGGLAPTARLGPHHSGGVAWFTGRPAPTHTLRLARCRTRARRARDRPQHPCRRREPHAARGAARVHAALFCTCPMAAPGRSFRTLPPSA